MNFDLATTLYGDPLHDGSSPSSTIDFEDTLVLNPLAKMRDAALAQTIAQTPKQAPTEAIETSEPAFDNTLPLKAMFSAMSSSPVVSADALPSLQAPAIFAQHVAPAAHRELGQCVISIPAWCVSYLPSLLDEQFYEAPDSHSDIPMLEFADLSAPNGGSDIVEVLQRLHLPFDAEGSYRNGRCETLFAGRLHDQRYELAHADTPPLDEVVNVVHCDRLILTGDAQLLADYISATLAQTVRNQAHVLQLRHAMPLAAIDEYEWLMQYEAAFGKEPERF
jgi:hypothetical protein